MTMANSDFDFRFSDSPNANNDSNSLSASSLMAMASCSKEKLEKEHCPKKRCKFNRISEDNEKKNKKKKGMRGKKLEQDSEPKISLPCSECGKKFWSWKALFGHMRCHPERQWRGMNPPPNIQRDLCQGIFMTEEDHEVAACLLLLANGTAIDTQQSHLRQSESSAGDVTATTSGEADGVALSGLNCRFECSKCNKIFGSHQALGGHRASHKNVKGCFANAITNTNTRSDNNENNTLAGTSSGLDHDDHVHGGLFVLGSGWGHKCSICQRVFPSGQALGGHKRCHWEKGDNDPSATIISFPPFSCSSQPCVVDLNLPAPHQVEHDTSSSPLTLDLRLGF